MLRKEPCDCLRKGPVKGTENVKVLTQEISLSNGANFTEAIKELCGT